MRVIIDIKVSNLDRAIDFYTKKLGLNVEDRKKIGQL
ncbi:MAG: catechol 2,3-dioxygenase-like lactoylglutathione lyase family enzyme [Patescibacteria group bacterium]|jgi:catechol 2,3-dioxygenase-like lactoylglutathione lyase family enzyme